MSSTNRGTERHGADYYVTPQSTIVEFLSAFTLKIDEPMHVLDPCAGGDATTPMAYPTALKEYGWPNIASMTTIDIRKDSPADIHADFLTWQPTRQFDLAITNPPFNIVSQVIEKCFTCTTRYIIMLLRLNYFGSLSRHNWWKRRMPIQCYVHSSRPRFLNTKNTDSIEYMHCVWEVGKTPSHAELRIV